MARHFVRRPDVPAVPRRHLVLAAGIDGEPQQQDDVVENRRDLGTLSLPAASFWKYARDSSYVARKKSSPGLCPRTDSGVGCANAAQAVRKSAAPNFISKKATIGYGPA